MSLTTDTIITTPNNQAVSIQNIQIGDTIETFNYSPQDGLSKGSPLKVEFSNVTSSAPVSQHIITITLENNTRLISSPDQKILTEGGKLKKANEITLLDLLFLADGSTTKIASIFIEHFKGITHNISTSLTPTTSLTHGNLFSANGMVVADYVLNIGESGYGAPLG
ncbi:intein [Roseivirga ehrenbergii]|uniref:Uncharacterized protein n=1 Tax=Roseivirga ehrenbergii (strain DSM 102268 / JCM 13514 / KCTC 12282 / NCIMB 14502 / KMM 6017) TaxID=279360 RepID=A0A150X8M3_ROSEK|nr:Hint domain-containing protein [Roseivirga ehrenbergii]KYG75002.1 hypothetical protein MB14_07320 [Roseivirga ehrenbergii]TCL13646.1 intein [Roseivirga ehrenbergii]